MSAYTEERSCQECDDTFALEDYGHTGAKAVAESLDAGNTEVLDDPESIANQCPSCSGMDTDKSKGEAMASIMMDEAMAEHEKKEAGRWFLITGGLGLSVSVIALLMLFLWGGLDPDVYPLYQFRLLILLAGGIVSTFVIVMGLSERYQ